MDNTHVSSSISARPTIGFLTCNIADPFASDLWLGIGDAARKHDANLLCFVGEDLCTQVGFKAQANILYKLASPECVDGLVLWGGAMCNFIGADAFQNFCRHFYPLPMVSVSLPLEGIHGIWIDNYSGMRQAMIHLIEVHGYRQIAFIRAHEYNREANERYRAYIETLQHYHIPFDPDLVLPPTPWDQRYGAQAIHTLLDQRQVTFEAVVAANDTLALGAITALQERGIQVPEDAAVMGFGNAQLGRYATPSLTTVPAQFYEQGIQAVDMLLALLAGKNIPEQIMLPCDVLVRQSCGCIDPAVVQADAGPIRLANKKSIEALPAKLPEILRVIGQQVSIRSQNVSQQRIERLCTAFLTELEGQALGCFLSELNEILSQAIAEFGNLSSSSEQDISSWQDVLSAFRFQILPYLKEPERLSQAENLWHQARVMIGEVAQKIQAFQAIQTAEQAQALRTIGARLISTFDVAELMNVIAEELPEQGMIRSCYLAMYEEQHSYIYPQPPPEWARLFLAYNRHGRIDLTPEGLRFRACCLIPKEFYIQETAYNMIVMPLYFREQQMGFLLYEQGPRTGIIYEALRAEISSALQGALLVRKVREQGAENARQKYILDTFINTVPDRIYFKDRESRITRSNTAHAESFGFLELTESIGKTDFDLFSEEQARIKFEQEQAIIRTGQPMLAQEESDGQGHWMLTTKMPLRNEYNEIIGTFGISRDITHLKQTEQELRQYRHHLEELVEERTEKLTQTNARLHEEILKREEVERALRIGEQQYRTMAEHVRDGIVITQNNRIVFLNRGFSAITGYTPGHVLMTEVGNLFQCSDRQKIQEWLTSETSGDSDVSRQFELVGREGRNIWVEMGQTELIWNSQSALLLTIRDITAQKHREQQLEEERTRLQQENVTLKSTIKERYRFGRLVGKSSVMQQVYERIISAAISDVNVLICGESGTGKELIARTIHQVSSFRKTRNFVAVNCASIPETLFEREFFGHRKGSFTGAVRDVPGFFDRAHQGVLFLDEVTELRPGTQAKLLRVLQDGEYLPVGSNTPKQANVLIIAATNKVWQKEIAQGRLRQDFFYRICVIEIDVPPLRNRKEDLPFLIETLLDLYRRRQTEVHGRTPHDLPTDQSMLPVELIRALYASDWPGNVRELQNVLQRYLATRDLGAVLPSLGVSIQVPDMAYGENFLAGMALPEAVQAYEKRMIAAALEQTNYHVGKTGELLGIPRRTLTRKIKHYQLSNKNRP